MPVFNEAGVEFVQGFQFAEPRHIHQAAWLCIISILQLQNERKHIDSPSIDDAIHEDRVVFLRQLTVSYLRIVVADLNSIRDPHHQLWRQYLSAGVRQHDRFFSF